MPRVILGRDARFFETVGGIAGSVRGTTTQQDINIATPTAQVAFRTGQLQQYPPAAGNPTNYTSGYGWEILSGGMGSAPIERGGVITWVSPNGGTQTITGRVYFGVSPSAANHGLVSVVFGEVQPAGTYGAQVFDQNGSALGWLGYFKSLGGWQGNISH